MRGAGKCNRFQRAGRRFAGRETPTDRVKGQGLVGREKIVLETEEARGRINPPLASNCKYRKLLRSQK